MHHDPIIPALDNDGLRKFAWTTAALVGGAFGLCLPWLFTRPWPVWPWPVAALLLVWGAVAPATLRPVYRLWMRIGLQMNRIMTPLVLGVVFFLMVTPVAVAMRIAGRARIPRRFDQALLSYRVISRKPPSSHMEKPF